MEQPINNFTDFTSANLNSQFDKFSNNSYVAGTKDFLTSNSLVARVAFLILVVLIFIFLLRTGSLLLSWLIAPKTEPYIIKHMKDAKVSKRITQNPSFRDSITLLRSKNEEDGIEFSYSVWLYINDVTTWKKGQYKHIFHKGSNQFATDGMAGPNNAPGMYISNDQNVPNKLVVLMNTFDSLSEAKIEIDNIPLDKWINVIIRVENKALDVYVNGTIVGRHVTNSVYKQNYGDVFVNQNGGFLGMLSALRYFNRGLTTMEIMDIVNTGPDLKMDRSVGNFPPYLSSTWYTNNT
jgi:hypothetical protein